MGVYDFAGLLCSGIISVLPYVVVFRLIDIIFNSVQSALFDGRLIFKGGR